MRILHNLDQIVAASGPCVVTIGNFDGVHLGHQQLLSRVRQAATAKGLQAVAVSFDPHPIRVLAPDRAPRTLTTMERRAALMEPLGIDTLVVLPFTRELARLSPAVFANNVLVNGLRAASVHVGPNFRFGYRQAGGVDTLAELGAAMGFEVEVIPAVEYRGAEVSSTRTRKALDEGRVIYAGRLLGRPFSNTGRIVSGRGVGRVQTVPTLNLQPREEQLPRTGVYVSRTILGGERYQSLTNIGYRPTFDNGHQLSVETYLLNFSGAVTQAEMEVEYLLRLRDEMKFHSAAILHAQIQEDVRRAGKFFSLLEKLGTHR
jgi:riboflavin kinase/FMN adenylyltransferase